MWQTALSQAVTDVNVLFDILELDVALLPAATRAAELFPLRVPHSFIARIEKGNIDDPLLRQILPIGFELAEVTGFTKDPLNEKVFNPLPGLLHKYAGRVLLTLTGACGVNCRYCFRRSFPYAENKLSSKNLEAILAYIVNDSSINEIILSGGDPLVTADNHLEKLIYKFAAIEHIKTVRIHSRMPVVIPARVTDSLVKILTATRLKTVMVIHCNHPNEINDEMKAAMQRLRDAKIILLNQTVLLKGVNDMPETLMQLSEKLFAAGVLPYYVHLLDKVQGSAHFEVDRLQAKQLVQTMIEHLPGYLVPKLVWEKSGARSKLPV